MGYELISTCLSEKFLEYGHSMGHSLMTVTLMASSTLAGCQLLVV